MYRKDFGWRDFEFLCSSYPPGSFHIFHWECVRLPFLLEPFMQLVTTSTQAKKYFDLHTTGVGYLNRIRPVKPKKGESFLACSISALHGDSDEPNITKFDLRVSGDAAQAIVMALKDDVAANKKVIVGFKIGDIYPEQYEVTVDDQKQLRLINKGRLLQITLVKVDSVLVDINKLVQAEERSGAENSDSALSRNSVQTARASRPPALRSFTHAQEEFCAPN